MPRRRKTRRKTKRSRSRRKARRRRSLPRRKPRRRKAARRKRRRRSRPRPKRRRKTRRRSRRRKPPRKPRRTVRRRKARRPERRRAQRSRKIEILAAAAGTPLSGSVGAGGANRAADVVALKRRLRALGFNWLGATAGVGADTVAAIRLFQAICRGRQRVAGAGVDGRVDPGGFTHRWLDAANAPRWQRMPPSNPEQGLRNAEHTAAEPRHEYGTDWMAQTLGAAAAAYRDAYLRAHPDAAPLTFRHASLPRGGPTPKHRTHQTGLACDCRVPRNDGSLWGVRWNLPGTGALHPFYDREAMRAMLRALRDQPLVRRALFNDPMLIAEGLCRRAAGHDDHLHFEIHAPARHNA